MQRTSDHRKENPPSQEHVSGAEQGLGRPQPGIRAGWDIWPPFWRGLCVIPRGGRGFWTGALGGYRGCSLSWLSIHTSAQVLQRENCLPEALADA